MKTQSLVVEKVNKEQKAMIRAKEIHLQDETELERNFMKLPPKKKMFYIEIAEKEIS